MEFREMVTMTLYARQQKRHRLLDSGKREGGMISENSTETCILPYVKQMASASSMHEAGHPKLVLWGNPEGQGGEGAASRVQGRGIP